AGESLPPLPEDSYPADATDLEPPQNAASDDVYDDVDDARDVAELEPGNVQVDGRPLGERTIKELRDLAESYGLDVSDARRKPALMERVAAEVERRRSE